MVKGCEFFFPLYFGGALFVKRVRRCHPRKQAGGGGSTGEYAWGSGAHEIARKFLRVQSSYPTSLCTRAHSRSTDLHVTDC